MPAKLQLKNQKFGSLLVVSENGRDAFGLALWRCKCDCGKETIVRGSAIKSGHSKSCGCGISVRSKIPFKQRLAGSEIYQRWSRMKQRCCNPNTKSWPYYGGRGIRVCERWLKFENFHADMFSTFKKGMEIDRRDNNGNYEPGNCRWVTHAENSNNRRSNRIIKIEGVSKTITEWSETSGLSRCAILNRIKIGLSGLKIISKK